MMKAGSFGLVLEKYVAVGMGMYINKSGTYVISLGIDYLAALGNL
jgi:hypothetical protein